MSSPSPLLNFVTRGFQIIFAAVVLGLSVGMIKGQGPTFNSPISLRYTAFVGGATFLAGFVGLAAEWVSVLQGKISLLMDALITLLNIAGGVVRNLCPAHSPQHTSNTANASHHYSYSPSK